jgi:hypothetical protein
MFYLVNRCDRGVKLTENISGDNNCPSNILQRISLTFVSIIFSSAFRRINVIVSNNDEYYFIVDSN